MNVALNVALRADGDQRQAGRSLHLFLADGTLHGFVTANIGNWNGNVLAVPRA